VFLVLALSHTNLNTNLTNHYEYIEELDGPAVSALWRAIAKVKQRLVGHEMGDQIFII
jgi:hypothetical protein